MGWWHLGLLSLLIVLFSSGSVKWVSDWETTRGRVAPLNRLVWNAATIHTGPFAGVYYWDYGYNRPILFLRTKSLFTSRFKERHLALVIIALPLASLLLWPATGLGLPPLRKRWHVLIGVAFVLGIGVWYFSAMVSIAMLS